MAITDRPSNWSSMNMQNKLSFTKTKNKTVRKSTSCLSFLPMIFFYLSSSPQTPSCQSRCPWKWVLIEEKTILINKTLSYLVTNVPMRSMGVCYSFFFLYQLLLLRSLVPSLERWVLSLAAETAPTPTLAAFSFSLASTVSAKRFHGRVRSIHADSANQTQLGREAHKKWLRISLVVQCCPE